AGLFACLLAVLVTLISERSAHASSFRIVVRVSSDTARGLRDRIAGQTSDLDVELTSVETPPLEPTLGEQLDAAAEWARRTGAQAVVWCDPERAPERGGFMLYVAEPNTSRVLVRRTGGERAAPSADLEAAALIVRLAVRALMRGGVIGV